MRIVIVDDEPLSRKHLERLLAAEPGLEIVARCEDVEQARSAIGIHDPDAIFLDIEMPGGSGLDLAREADIAGRPLVVIVTAHPKYAVDAFDVAPADYLLKPPDTLHCRRAVGRLRRLLAIRSPAVPESGGSYLTRLFAKQGERIVHIPVHTIDIIEALGSYFKVRFGGNCVVVRGSLSALESRLDPSMFARTHRSYIVNLSKIRELEAISHGDFRVLLDGGGSVPLSRAYRDRLFNGFRQPIPARVV